MPWSDDVPNEQSVLLEVGPKTLEPPSTFELLVSSLLRFFRNTLIICYVLMGVLAGSWWAGWLGDDCRYNGSVVAGCNFLGLFSVDGIADLILTPFVLPVIGLFVGLVAPFMHAFTLTMFFWPPYAVVKFLIRFLRR